MEYIRKENRHGGHNESRIDTHKSVGLMKITCLKKSHIAKDNRGSKC